MDKRRKILTTLIGVGCICILSGVLLYRESAKDYPVTISLEAGISLENLRELEMVETAAEPTTEASTEASTETTTTVETEPETTTTEALPEYYPFSYDEVVALAKMVYGEAGSSPRDQKRLVAIVAFNHYDKHCNGGYTLWDIVTDRNQFMGYSSSKPVTDEIWNICIEVIQDYNNGKVNWADYYYFRSTGDGINNYFY